MAHSAGAWHRPRRHDAAAWTIGALNVTANDRGDERFYLSAEPKKNTNGSNSQNAAREDDDAPSVKLPSMN